MRDFLKLKVCYLAGTLAQGGAEQQLYYAVRGLRHAGAAVRVLCLERGGFWEEPIRRLQVPVTWVGQSGSRLRRVMRILKELIKDRPEVFQSQHFYANAYVAVAGRLRKCVTIGAVRSNGRFDMSGCGRIGGWLNLRLPGWLAANSRCSMNYILEKGIPASRVCYLPNVVDTEHFHPAAVSAAPLTLLAVGRLSQEKRFDRFLTILHRLRHEQHLEVRGLVTGGPRPGESTLPQLQEQASALGLLPDGVQFLGAVADLRPVYRQASVCVLTSDHEGSPNVLLEAMASGVPIVATRVGGVPEIVQHGQNGFMLAPDDLDGLTATVLRLLSQPGLRPRMAACARTFIEENHSAKRIQLHLSQLYQATLPNLSVSHELRFGEPVNAVRPGT